MQTGKIYLKYLEPNDVDELLRLRKQNRKFFQAYEPVRTDIHFTYETQLNEIHQYRLDAESDNGYTMGIFSKSSNKLMGRISLSGIARGPFQNANLGYYLDKEQNGKGYVTEAVSLIIGFAFGELNLHRIQAAVMPKNLGSIRILEKNGFRKEGSALRYLSINGVWEDHEIYALTKEDYTIHR
ncbi:GNAT family protein [Neobacillus rhizosphaerae]|uniref:GNAT family N-acetyltransferase n=1 Tax=Neobacillus rhizosphaerae TaxID=2880965 RepID=UPI003D2E4822